MKKSFCLGLLGLVMLPSMALAQYNKQEVIYKIHDISPVKEDGKVVSCDYSITFYNRSSTMLSNLSIELQWLDEVIDTQIKKEKQEKYVDKKTKISGYTGKSKTEEYTTKSIISSFAVPPLAPSKQISLKRNIQTDRCFLLMQKPTLKVTSCLYSGQKSENSAGVCQDMMRLITPADGDYFTEFKPISYDIEKKQIEEENAKEKKEMDKIYNDALNSINAVTEALRNMK